MTPLPPSRSPTVAEIVTFALCPGVDPDSFAEAAAALDGWLATVPGFAGRTLSRAEDGTWTDQVLWSDHAAATAAAEAMPARPEAAAFLAAIDPASVAMRHARVVHRQTA